MTTNKSTNGVLEKIVLLLTLNIQTLVVTIQLNSSYITYITMITKAQVKSWGSSLGVIVPRDIVYAEHLKEGDEIIIEIKKKPSLRDIFGTLRDWKVNPQKLKDDARKEWG